MIGGKFSNADEAISFLLDNTCRGLLLSRNHMRVRQDSSSFLIIEDNRKAAFIVYDPFVHGGRPDFEEVDYDYAVKKYFW